MTQIIIIAIRVSFSKVFLPFPTIMLNYLSGNFIFIDSNGTSSRHTSSKRTSRRSDFRASVIERDGDRCVITRASSRACDAAHIIPRCKGEEVSFVTSPMQLTEAPFSTLQESSKIVQSCIQFSRSLELMRLRMEFSCAKIYMQILAMAM